MTKLKWNFKPAGWKKIPTLLLAVCMCVTSVETGAQAAVPVANSKGQSPWDASESIVFSDDELLLPAGDTAYLDVFYEDFGEDYGNSDDYYDMDLEWSSSNKKVATVDGEGEITGIKAGTAVITAETYTGATASCTVTVAHVTLNHARITVPLGKNTGSLFVKKKFPKYDTIEEWYSDNERIATVNQKGQITGKKKGTTTITLTMESGAEARCKVTVTGKKPATKRLVFSKKKIILAKGSKKALTIKREPRNASEKISWTSSNANIVKVTSKGMAIGRKPGTAIITAKTTNGKKASCTVIVKKPSITLKKNNITLKAGKSVRIKVKSVFPKNDKVKSYKSNKPKVAVVNAKGKVTAKKPGKAQITVITKCGAKASFVVTVK